MYQGDVRQEAQAAHEAAGCATRRISPLWILPFVVFACWYVASYPARWRQMMRVGMMAEARQNLHAVQLALERYAVDHAGTYPSDLQALYDNTYLPGLPDNPYADPPRGPMPVIPPGQHTPGGIVYLTHLGDTGAGRSVADGYALLVYGDEVARRRMQRKHENHRCPLPGGAETVVDWDYALIVMTGGKAAAP